MSMEKQKYWASTNHNLKINLCFYFASLLTSQIILKGYNEKAILISYRNHKSV
jgi:hypothetical protein